MHINKFCMELYTFEQMSRFVAYNSFSENGKHMETFRNLSAQRKTTAIFNWNFVLLHRRYCCLTWVALEFSTVLDNFEINN